MVLDARIRFLRTEEGGRLRAPADGVRSQLDLGEVKTSCIVHTRDARKEIALGEEQNVRIELIFGSLYEAAARRLTNIDLYEGNKLVARGLTIETHVEEG
ncbi:hypothetical protein GC089_03165 [Cellulomonas sp. JZ18]|uniref:hypothetical protein n=1 Tax=Cellulomonas sp. JZ18 TaxID=2654191 RepID=UPI0012D39AEB|nr:hypothetical protein [Cellulomonas sp. JZ18]QGQ18437.1 hypothetical protein GC089_03165 [Cellulomonas sp. JZ18]